MLAVALTTLVVLVEVTNGRCIYGDDRDCKKECRRLVRNGTSISKLPDVGEIPICGLGYI